MLSGVTRSSRRGCLQATVLAGVSLLGGTSVGLALMSDRPCVEHVVVPRGTDAESAPLEIAQLSDLHVETERDVRRLALAVSQILVAHPDMIVLTGDYVRHRAHAIDLAVPQLSRLAAPLGVYAVLGNHDLWTDRRVVTEGLRRAGITVLVNQGTMLSTNGKAVYLAGLDDGWSGQPDLDRALADHVPGVPVILLFHEPDLGESHVKEGRVWLQLSGHSHGGQVRVPGRGALVLPDYARRYDMGLYQVGPGWIYVNRGLGHASVPVRFNCAPEITLLRLAVPMMDAKPRLG